MKSLIWKFFKKISSLQFSIFLLLLIASISILGTVLEQDQSMEYYKLNYPENKQMVFAITWKQIAFLGLNHLYSNIWFLVILLLFFASLVVCTFSTQLPVLKHSRQWSFLYHQSSLKKNWYYKTQRSSFINYVYILNLHNYYVFHKGQAVYAYKGLLGRIAPIFVHASLILSLTGSVIGFSAGFLAQEMIPNGEFFHLQNIVKAGYFSRSPNEITAKINDFFITLNTDKSVKQFYSHISVFSNKSDELWNQYISVNHPLKIKGITYYQTDWQVNALRIKIGRNYLFAKNLKKILSDTSDSMCWFCNLQINENHKVAILIPDLSDQIFIYNKDGTLITKAQYGICNVIYGIPVVFKDLITSTGLQIKVDPGIRVAYLGFLVLMLSVMFSYTSYSQIWINKDCLYLNFSANTNRAFLKFENEVVKIHRKYIFLLLFNQ